MTIDINSTLTALLSTGMTVGVSFIGKEIFNYLKGKRYFPLVKNVVLSVESNFKGMIGSDKKAKAIDMAYNLAGGKISKSLISTLIEDAVFQMKSLNNIIFNNPEVVTSAPISIPISSVDVSNVTISPTVIESIVMDIANKDFNDILNNESINKAIENVIRNAMTNTLVKPIISSTPTL